MIPIVLALVAASVVLAYWVLVRRTGDDAADNWRRTWERRRRNAGGDRDKEE